MARSLAAADTLAIYPVRLFVNLHQWAEFVCTVFGQKFLASLEQYMAGCHRSRSSLQIKPLTSTLRMLPRCVSQRESQFVNANLNVSKWL